MRKLRRVMLITLAIIVAIPLLFLATTATVNAVATNAEAAEITSYGQLVPVDGKHMNVVVSGQGSETIVLMPGLGTAAPGLDFQPLIQELAAQYRVIAVEPFGTGLSDQTGTARTGSNIAREVHEALQYLEIDRYVLMGHSMAGIYALTYSATYPDEVRAFVGIDTSVPKQPGWNERVPTDAIAVLKDLGITRVLTSITGDPYAGGPYDEKTRRQLNLLTTKNAAAPTLLNEVDNAPTNFEAVSGMTFPKDLPVLLFVRTKNIDVEGWVDLHQRQAASVDKSRMITIDGEHYLHRTHSPLITQATSSFLNTLSSR
ncbi:alpha/beta fold hydrolase [Arthrobacter sp. ISL-95]|uniref:alpha/beta fold hydrolase n=1 Tax=Arthrobacter sp. ISL-95 TaxID=2819116 RepID=UPI001BEC91E2|nr:alpha/beta hydrolase [Arthrobacter sp. ISL-95]MBT2585615.1 alpha/beta hydrolase [Arthrobacter sp. ISL-95]